jgi:hypothetical protein
VTSLRQLVSNRGKKKEMMLSQNSNQEDDDEIASGISSLSFPLF